MKPAPPPSSGSATGRHIFLAAMGAFWLTAALVGQQRPPQLPAPAPARPNPSRLIPRPDGAQPKVPDGFSVGIYADDLQAARMMEWAPNGDLFVSQTGANSISVLRDTNNDGTPDMRTVFVQGPAPARRGGPPPAPAAGGGAAGAAEVQVRERLPLREPPPPVPRQPPVRLPPRAHRQGRGRARAQEPGVELPLSRSARVTVSVDGSLSVWRFSRGTSTSVTRTASCATSISPATRRRVSRND